MRYLLHMQISKLPVTYSFWILPIIRSFWIHWTPRHAIPICSSHHSEPTFNEIYPCTCQGGAWHGVYASLATDPSPWAWRASRGSRTDFQLNAKLVDYYKDYYTLRNSPVIHWIRWASVASWRASIAERWNLRSVLNCREISRTTRWKGALGIRSPSCFW